MPMNEADPARSFQDDDPRLRKTALRQGLRARRRGLSERERSEVASALAIRVGAIAEVAALVASPTSGCLAAYASFGSEPGTRRLRDILEISGVRVLLPIMCADGSLAWAWDDGHLTPGKIPPHIPEPSGPVVAEGIDGLLAQGCTVVLVPALAVDAMGNRLGQAGGYYDRMLAGLDTLEPDRHPLLVAVVHDHELLDHLPTEPHDRPVDAALTPTRVVRFRNT